MGTVLCVDLLRAGTQQDAAANVSRVVACGRRHSFLIRPSEIVSWLLPADTAMRIAGVLGVDDYVAED